MFFFSNFYFFACFFVFFFLFFFNQVKGFFFFDCFCDVFYFFSNFFNFKFLCLDSTLSFFHFVFFTNLDFFLLLNFIFNVFFFICILNNSLVYLSKNLGFLEILFEWLMSSFKNQNSFKAQSHFVFIFTLFFFILFSNLIGMIPFSFTLTSHIFQTFTIGCSLIISLTLFAFTFNGFFWILIFLPNVSVFIIPLFIFIETVSYISRAFSLSIRLFANLMSGHTLLNILTGFVIKIGSVNVFFFFLSLIPFALICSIVVLESLIAFLQAYVFVTLFGVYLNDTYLVLFFVKKSNFKFLNLFSLLFSYVFIYFKRLINFCINLFGFFFFYLVD